jgi:Urocanase Rossmann-like domain
MHDEPASDGPPHFRMPAVARVRAFYSLLCAVAASQFGTRSLAGRLLLIDGLAEEGDALLVAASIAGAASLVPETQPEAIRYCIRNGIVDFAVTTITEALRILKNEIRKQQPIAVLVEREPEDVMAEMVERGVQPDVLRWSTPDPALKGYIDILRERGAWPLPPTTGSPQDSPHTGAHDGLSDSSIDVCWRAGEGGGSSALRQLDLLAAQILPEQDAERQNWIARAPRYLSRALRLERRVAMSERERSAFIAAVEERAQQGALAAQVKIDVDGQVRSFGS